MNTICPHICEAKASADKPYINFIFDDSWGYFPFLLCVGNSLIYAYAVGGNSYIGKQGIYPAEDTSKITLLVNMCDSATQHRIKVGVANVGDAVSMVPLRQGAKFLGAYNAES